MKTVTAIAQLVAAETTCGMSYDSPAVTAWVQSHVAADDIQFGAQFQSLVQGDIYSQKEMSGAARTIFCTQSERTAKALGFIN